MPIAKSSLICVSSLKPLGTLNQSWKIGNKSPGRLWFLLERKTQYIVSLQLRKALYIVYKYRLTKQSIPYPAGCRNRQPLYSNSASEKAESFYKTQINVAGSSKNI